MIQTSSFTLELQQFASKSKQLHERHAKSVGEGIEVFQLRVSLAPFDSGKIGHMHSRSEGEFLWESPSFFRCARTFFPSAIFIGAAASRLVEVLPATSPLRGGPAKQNPDEEAGRAGPTKGDQVSKSKSRISNARILSGLAMRKENVMVGSDLANSGRFSGYFGYKFPVRSGR